MRDCVVVMVKRPNVCSARRHMVEVHSVCDTQLQHANLVQDYIPQSLCGFCTSKVMKIQNEDKYVK